MVQTIEQMFTSKILHKSVLLLRFFLQLPNLSFKGVNIEKLAIYCSCLARLRPSNLMDFYNSMRFLDWYPLTQFVGKLRSNVT